MRKRFFVFLGVCVCVLFIIAKNNRAQRENGFQKKVPGIRSDDLQSHGKLKVAVDFAKIPLYFISNRGQVNPIARFFARTSRYTLWLTEEGLVFDRIRKQEAEKQNTGEEKQDTPFKNDQCPMTNDRLPLTTHHSPFTKYDRDVSRLMFIGANKNANMKAVRPAALKVNYFIGNDKSKWHCDVPTSLAVRYENLYKNIDLKVYGVEKQIEYDWLVRPDGDPQAIKFEYKDVSSTHIDNSGNIVIATLFGELVHKKPMSYQVIGSKKQPVEVRFKKTGPDIYGFSVGNYDKSHDLIIDPLVLVYSTYLGSSYQEGGSGIAADDSGNVYVTGSTDSVDFPTLGEYMSDPGDNKTDAFISKINTTRRGTASLVYSTYLGGSDADWSFGIAADKRGNVYVTGETHSSDFPIKNQYMIYPGDVYFQNAFVTKIDTTQSGADGLLYSTYLGGLFHDYGYGISADKSDNAYVTGYTWSYDFPIKSQYMSWNGIPNVFVSKIDTTRSGKASLVYSTYLGGSDKDYGRGIATDESGNAYVTGYTISADFPVKNQYMTDPEDDDWDAFVTKLDTTQKGAASLVYSTYLGGSSWDYGLGIAADNSGNAYVTGYTYSAYFPIKNQYMAYTGGNLNAFVSKIDTTRSGKASLIYSTYLGGSSDDAGWGIAADNSGNTYVTGETRSIDFPTKNQYMSDPGDNHLDAFVSKIDTTKNGNVSLIYSTYLGGSYMDYGRGIATDDSGNAYVTGETFSIDFPLKNAYLTDIEARNNYVFITKMTIPVYYIFLNLSASRETETAWIIRRQFGKLILAVDNPKDIHPAKYIIYSKDHGGNYSPLAEISGNDIQNAPYLYYDKYLEKDKTYSYKFAAVDAKEVIIGLSNEISI